MRTGLVAPRPVGSSQTRDWTPTPALAGDSLPPSHQGSPWRWLLISLHYHQGACSVPFHIFLNLLRLVLWWNTWASLEKPLCALEKRRRQWWPTPVLLPGESHGRRSLVGCSPWGRYEWDTTEKLHFHFSLACIGDGNGGPLVFLLENPRDGGAWWAAVYGVAQSRTRLKRLSSSSTWEEQVFWQCVNDMLYTCLFGLAGWQCCSSLPVPCPL